MEVRQETEVTDTDETLRQYVHEKSPNEIFGRNGHLFLFVAVSVITPSKRHDIAIERNQSMIGNRNAMGVASKVPDDLFGSAECRFGVDHPVLAE